MMDTEATQTRRGRKKIYDDREKITFYADKNLLMLIDAICSFESLSRSEFVVNTLNEYFRSKKELTDQLLALKEKFFEKKNHE